MNQLLACVSDPSIYDHATVMNSLMELVAFYDEEKANGELTAKTAECRDKAILVRRHFDRHTRMGTGIVCDVVRSLVRLVLN